MDLSNRATVSKKIPEIDSIYAYKTRHTAPFTQRHQEGVGYRYSNHKALESAKEGEIYIYHQTALIDGVENGLTMVTKDKRKTIVQKFFKESIDEIKKDGGLTHQFKTAKASPSQLGIYYNY